jgi:hypothetical protein
MSATGMGVSLELNDEEKELVQEILEERQRTLLLEISHTDRHEFKIALRRNAQLLESVLRQFAAPA